MLAVDTAKLGKTLDASQVFRTIKDDTEKDYLPFEDRDFSINFSRDGRGEYVIYFHDEENIHAQPLAFKFDPLDSDLVKLRKVAEQLAELTSGSTESALSKIFS